VGVHVYDAKIVGKRERERGRGREAETDRDNEGQAKVRDTRLEEHKRKSMCGGRYRF
jgi:hypothetical protein